jgi:hypothetical protein
LKRKQNNIMIKKQNSNILWRVLTSVITVIWMNGLGRGTYPCLAIISLKWLFIIIISIMRVFVDNNIRKL